MKDEIIELLAHDINEASESEFNIEQCKRMVRFVFAAYAQLNRAIEDITGRRL